MGQGMRKQKLTEAHTVSNTYVSITRWCTGLRK